MKSTHYMLPSVNKTSVLLQTIIRRLSGAHTRREAEINLKKQSRMAYRMSFTAAWQDLTCHLLWQDLTCQLLWQDLTWQQLWQDLTWQLLWQDLTWQLLWQDLTWQLLTRSFLTAALDVYGDVKPKVQCYVWCTLTLIKGMNPLHEIWVFSPR